MARGETLTAVVIANGFETEKWSEKDNFLKDPKNYGIFQEG